MKNLYILRKKDKLILFNTYYKGELYSTNFEEVTEEKLFSNSAYSLFTTNFENLENDLKKLNINKHNILVISLIDIIEILNKIRKR